VNCLSSLSAVDRGDFPYVPVHFARVERQPPRRDTLLSSEISRCDKSEIAAESSHQPREIGNAGADVLIDHEAAANAKRYGCGGHQLHDSGGPFRGDCGGLPA
jgi:hypothetical protein